MPPLEPRRSADDVQKALQPLMSEHGFNKRGRTFHRQTMDGLTQVVHLQMGRSDPPGTTFMPGLRENLYGAVTVNLGVFVPELGRVLGHRSRNIQESECCLRIRIGELLPDTGDVWWDLGHRERAEREIGNHLRKFGFPWLDGLSTREEILKALEGHSRRLAYTAVPPRIISAVILVERGAFDEARDLLAAQAGESGDSRHVEYVRSLAHKLNVGELDA